MLRMVVPATAGRLSGRTGAMMLCIITPATAVRLNVLAFGPARLVGVARNLGGRSAATSRKGGQRMRQHRSEQLPLGFIRV